MVSIFSKIGGFRPSGIRAPTRFTRSVLLINIPQPAFGHYNEEL